MAEIVVRLVGPRPKQAHRLSAIRADRSRAKDWAGGFPAWYAPFGAVQSALVQVILANKFDAISRARFLLRGKLDLQSFCDFEFLWLAFLAIGKNLLFNYWPIPSALGELHWHSVGHPLLVSSHAFKPPSSRRFSFSHPSTNPSSSASAGHRDTSLA